MEQKQLDKLIITLYDKKITMDNDPNSIPDGLNLVKSDDTDGNITRNGWCKFDNGLIMQWGYRSVFYPDSAHIYTPYNLVFPNQCFMVVFMGCDGWHGGDGPSPVIISYTSSGFTSASGDGGMFGNTWIALGK